MDQGLQYLKIKRYEKAVGEFLKVLEIEPENEVAEYNVACAYSLWGKTDDALKHLARAIELGFDDVEHIDKDPDLDPIRQHERFKALTGPLRGRKPEEKEGER